MISFIYGKSPGDFGGEEQKNKSLLEILSGVGINSTFQNDSSDFKLIRYIIAIIFFVFGRSARVGYFYPLNLSFALRKDILNAEVIFISLPQNVSLRLLKEARQKDKVILVDFADLISETYRKRSRYSTFPMNVFWSIEARRFEKFENQVSALSTKKYFASALDCFSPNSSQLPPPTKLKTFLMQKNKPQKIPYFVFGGALTVFQNKLALSFLQSCAKQYLVSIKIYGNVDKSFPTKYPNLEFLGQVNDIQALMADSSGFIAPVPVSGGIQNKVLEALAMKTPVYTDYSVLQRIGISEFYPARITYNDSRCHINLTEKIDNLSIDKASNFVGKHFGKKVFENFLLKEMGEHE